MANSKVFFSSGVMSTYDTPGTYTWSKDANTRTVTILGWGGGGGGGSGYQGISGGASGGGGGGNGGCFFIKQIPTSFWGTSETIVVGTGGTGGASQSNTSSAGNAGTDGTNSSVGNISTTIGLPQKGDAIGNGGRLIFGAHTGSAHNRGGGGVSSSFTVDGGSFYVYNDAPLAPKTAAVSMPGLTAEGNPGRPDGPVDTYNLWLDTAYEGGYANTSITATGGGAGSGPGTFSGQASNGTPIADFFGNIILAGGVGGIESGTIDGGNGNSQITTGGLYTGGTGGGGGGCQKTGIVAGIGGNGGFPGGGGGGGGGSLNGCSSGAGGSGAGGLVIVIEYF